MNTYPEMNEKIAGMLRLGNEENAIALYAAQRIEELEHEVEAQQEELGRLRKVLMEFRNEFYNLQLMAKALSGIEVKPSAFEKLVIQIDDVLARRVLAGEEE